MATLYNITAATNTTSIVTLAQNLNTVSGGLIGTSIVFIGFFVTFVAMKGWENKDAFAASSFGWSVITYLLFLAGVVPETPMFAFVIIGLIGLLMLLLRD